MQYGPPPQRRQGPGPVEAILGVLIFGLVIVVAWQAGRLSGLEDSTAGEPSLTVASAAADTSAEAANLSRSDPGPVGGKTRVWAVDTGIQAPKMPPRSPSSSVVERAVEAQAGIRPESGSGSVASQVRTYFNRMEVAGAAASSVTDPNELAQSIMGQAMSGDTSGIRSLAAGQQKAIDAMKAIQPPSVCQEHHRLSIRTLEQGRDVLESLALGMESGDMTQVLSASSKAQGLTADAEKVDAIGERLKAKYGI